MASIWPLCGPLFVMDPLTSVLIVTSVTSVLFCSVPWLWLFIYIISVFLFLPLKWFIYQIELCKCFGLTNYPWLFCIPYTVGIIFLTLLCAYSCYPFRWWDIGESITPQNGTCIWTDDESLFYLSFFYIFASFCLYSRLVTE